MELRFSGEIIYWRGPAPFLFVRIPEAESDDIAAVAPMVTYGWGAIPVNARIGGTDFYTALFPKDGAYLLPVKVAVQRAEGVDVGDVVDVELSVGGASRR
ncbi:DUF1905 domain-containing protein [Gryllotalpicola ginsengisoli]|uniref:DUF1905 domain-containing protein n=1 Tax=Gryllotalpicola ginsengisoli TaxID=444608 RepID=UPI0003B592AF|nr:DUF1905 domain-containing protein [Gryllotalpicola ginsengisoli]